MRASDEERLYQCLTCLFTESCNLDESAEDERGLCKEYRINEDITRKMICPLLTREVHKNSALSALQNAKKRNIQVVIQEKDTLENMKKYYDIPN